MISGLKAPKPDTSISISLMEISFSSEMSLAKHLYLDGRKKSDDL